MELTFQVFYVDARNPNSDLHAHAVNTFMTELCLQPLNSLLKTSVTADKHIGRQCPQDTPEVSEGLAKWSVQLSSALSSPLFLFMDQHWILVCFLSLIMPSVHQHALKPSPSKRRIEVTTSTLLCDLLLPVDICLASPRDIKFFLSGLQQWTVFAEPSPQHRARLISEPQI